MKIGIYIANTGVQNGGIFVHSIGVIKCLLGDSRFQEVVVFHSRDQVDHLEGLQKDSPKVRLVLVGVNDRRLARLAYRASVFLRDMRELLWGDYKNGLFGKAAKWASRVLNPYSKILQRAAVDLIHVPSQISPVYNILCPIVISMHDLQELHFPQFFTPEERIRRAIHYKRTLEDADHVIVTFSHVKEDIKTYFGVNDSSISVCTLPFGKNWFQAKVPEQTKALRHKHGIPDRYILYPAATWPHKNHLGLFRALQELKTRGLDVQVVCTGYKTQHFPQLWMEIVQLGCQDQAHFLGIVPEEDLLGLYRDATLVVIPTFYEAGSGPLYEAMWFQSPVICSSVTSLPSAIGNPEFVFDPADIRQMADLIEKGCSDELFRQRNLENSRRICQMDSSLGHSDTFWQAYSAALDNWNALKQK